MNFISNIWKHPKTTIVGLLLGIVQVGSVLAQNGVGFGSAGSTTWVGLGVGIATALLGAISRDPGTASSGAASVNSRINNSGSKLSAWAMILLLLMCGFESGCTGSQVAQDIVNWTPALQAAVTTVDSTAALLAPADAPIFTAATMVFDADSAVLVAQANTYLASPSGGALTLLQNEATTLTQDVNGALLQANGIKDSASQQHAVAAIQSVAVIAVAILALVQSVSNKSATARMATASKIKLAAVRPYVDSSKAYSIVAAHYGEPEIEAALDVSIAGYRLERAGF